MNDYWVFAKSHTEILLILSYNSWVGVVRDCINEKEN